MRSSEHFCVYYIAVSTCAHGKKGITEGNRSSKMSQEESFWGGEIMQRSDSDGRWDVTQLFFPFIKWLISETSVCRSVCLSLCLSVPPAVCCQVEEKQRASVAFTKLLTAMETLGFSAGEQKAIWHVLAGIYHLGAAGACRGNTDSSSSLTLCQ